MKLRMIVLVLLTSAAGCFRVRVDPVEVKPITLNVNLKIERQLDEFFAFEKTGAATAPSTPASTQPATAAQ